MKKIKVNTGRNYFAIVTLNGKAYVCPGWHEVPIETTRDQIELVMDVKTTPNVTLPEVKPEPPQEWSVEASKPGKFYQVTNVRGRWDCTFPAKTFHRGDCKHIKKIKFEKVEKTFA